MEIYRRRRSRGGWILVSALIGAFAAVAGAYVLWPRSDPPEAIAAPRAAEPFAVLSSGDRALEIGDWPAAEASYRRAAALDATSASAQIGLARALVFQYRSKDAVEHARRAVEIAPRRASAQAALALALNWAGDVEGAASAARRSIDLDPNMAEGHAFLAEAFADRYQLADAWRSLDRALALDPNGVEPRRVRAYLLETEGRYSDAASAYLEALEVAAGHGNLLFSLGTVYRVMGKVDSAAEQFRNAIAASGSDARPRAGMALIYLQQSDYGAALPYLEEAVRLDTQYATAQGQLGTTHYFLGNFERAREPLEAALRLEKNKDRLGTYHHVLGWVYLKSDLLDLAQPEFEAALALNPGFQGAKDGLEALRAARSR